LVTTHGWVNHAGTVVFGAVSDVVIVAVLTVYFLADMPRIRATLYRFVPNYLFPDGSTIGGFIVAAVALTVSIPVSIATVGF
jgi:predicted PurR-regulated permease PerM